MYSATSEFIVIHKKMGFQGFLLNCPSLQFFEKSIVPSQMFECAITRPPLPEGTVLEKDGDERGTWIYSSFLLILRNTESLILAQDERWRRA
jgi:hypothetical protein